MIEAIKIVECGCSAGVDSQSGWGVLWEGRRKEGKLRLASFELQLFLFGSKSMGEGQSHYALISKFTEPAGQQLVFAQALSYARSFACL